MKTLSRLLSLSLLFTAIMSCSKSVDIVVPEPFFDFNLSEMRLRTGETQTIELNDKITNYSFSEITYVSMDESIAKIVNGRTVQSLAQGSTIIKAMHERQELDRFNVSIVDAVVTAISIVPAMATLNEGRSLQLNPLLTPVIAKDKSVIWSSSDTNVATVSQEGKIIAVKTGDAIISGTTVTNLTVKCIVKVIQ
jgi:hypothetical protein